MHYEADRLGFLKKLKKLRKKTLHGKIRGAILGRRKKGRRPAPPVAVPTAVPTLTPVGTDSPIFYESPPLYSLPTAPIATPQIGPPMAPTYYQGETTGLPPVAPSAFPPAAYPPQYQMPQEDFGPSWGQPPEPDYAPIDELPGWAAAEEREYDVQEIDAAGASPWPGLAGAFPWSPMTDYLRAQWDRAVASLRSRVARFRALRGELAAARVLADKAADVATANRAPGSALLRLRELRARVEGHERDQATLESKVTSAMAKIEAVAGSDAQAAQMGVLPLAVPVAVTAASIAAVVALGAGVVIHTQRVEATARELDQVARGVLSADQIAKVKNAGPLGGLGSLFAGLPLLALAGVGIYLLSRSRRAA